MNLEIRIIRDWAELLKRSLELWRVEKALLVMFGLTERASIQEAMAAYLVEIGGIEKKFILMLKEVILNDAK